MIGINDLFTRLTGVSARIGHADDLVGGVIAPLGEEGPRPSDILGLARQATARIVAPACRAGAVRHAGPPPDPIGALIIAVAYQQVTLRPADALLSQAIEGIVAEPERFAAGVALGDQIAQGVVAVRPGTHVGIGHAQLAPALVIAYGDARGTGAAAFGDLDQPIEFVVGIRGAGSVRRDDLNRPAPDIAPLGGDVRARVGDARLQIVIAVTGEVAIRGGRSQWAS